MYPRAEWADDCNCSLGQAFGNRARPIFFASDAEAIQYWLTMRTSDNSFFAAHARPGRHLLTVHVPHICSCSVCSPEFYK